MGHIECVMYYVFSAHGVSVNSMSEGDTAYECTKPRVPIAASYKGPGPCYALPGLVGRQQHDPRSRHHRAPAYHFGIRPAQYADERSVGPGPCYLPPTTVNHAVINFDYFTQLSQDNTEIAEL